MQTIPMTMQNLMHAARFRQSDFGAPCRLAYPLPCAVPPAFNRLAYTDYAVLSEADDTVEWDDYCPAYALGLLTFETYYRGQSLLSQAELETQWDEFRGESRLSWEQAREIIARSWNALACLEQDARIQA